MDNTIPDDPELFARFFCAALRYNELDLWYQPILDLSENKVVAREALVRWNHPTMGMLQPSAFFKQIATAGMWPLLDRWVLRRSLKNLAQWQAMGYTEQVAVNLSIPSVQDPFLATAVTHMVETTGCDPKGIIIELNEHQPLCNQPKTRTVLNGLRKLGVTLAIDDFGSGYASLKTLQWAPIDILKLDRAFLSGEQQGHRSQALLSALVHLGKTLGLRVVAEGVEEPAQIDWLHTVGCPLAQGYFIGRPQPFDVIAI